MSHYYHSLERSNCKELLRKEYFSYLFFALRSRVILIWPRVEYGSHIRHTSYVMTSRVWDNEYASLCYFYSLCSIIIVMIVSPQVVRMTSLELFMKNQEWQRSLFCQSWCSWLKKHHDWEEDPSDHEESTLLPLLLVLSKTGSWRC